MFCQGGFLQHFKGSFFVKVGFCNNVKVGVLSSWVFATFLLGSDINSDLLPSTQTIVKNDQNNGDML